MTEKEIMKKVQELPTWYIVDENGRYITYLKSETLPTEMIGTTEAPPQMGDFEMAYWDGEKWELKDY